MINYHCLFVPKENANDSEVLVASILKSGEIVKKDLSVLAEFEGSKAITDFISPHSGFFLSFL